MTAERTAPGSSAQGNPGLTAAPVVPPDEGPLQPGLLLEQFRILGPLGRGGMGVVYEAEDTLLRRRVALKVLPHSAQDDASLARLLREAQAVARLNHPHVVGIHHIGRWQGGYFLVLELMRGGSLQARLDRDGPLPWLAATQAVADACRGLQAAHAAGLTHRDVKPANLMCDEARAVKVADFGLVRGSDFTPMTMAHLLGTPYFMSPEQCRGEPADERSDLYALGATYFALLTGTPPYRGGTPVQVMFAHCTMPVPDPRVQHPELPDACAAIVRRAMAKEPVERFQSASEMLTALVALTAQEDSAGPDTPRKEPISSGGPQSGPAGAKVALTPRAALRRPRLLVACLGLAVLLLAVGLAWYFELFPRPESSPSPVALSGDLIVRIHSEDKPGLVVDRVEALPVRNGEEVDLEVQLNRPAHIYLLWITSSGRIQPLYPWNPRRGFADFQPTDTPKKVIHSPEPLDPKYTMRGAGGLETALLLVRDTPLQVDLAREIGRLPATKLRNPREVAWLELVPGQSAPRLYDFQGRDLEVGEADETDDPILRLMERLRPHFVLMKAVRFAHQGD